MAGVFVDAVYLIALARPDDQWRQAAVVARERLGESSLVTTDEVLSEFLAALAGGGPHLRDRAAKTVRSLLDSPNTRVIPQSRRSFELGLRRYEDRLDKGYSLQDCISMNVMESEGVTQILTSDHHFEQEGFTVLMTSEA